MLYGHYGIYLTCLPTNNASLVCLMFQFIDNIDLIIFCWVKKTKDFLLGFFSNAEVGAVLSFQSQGDQ